MAQLILAAAGAAVGFAIGGPTGAQWGWIAGSTLGGMMNQPSFEGPRLGDLSVTSSAYGSVIPYLEGHTRMAGQVIWASEKREIATTTSQGKGGGSEYTTYNYEVDLHILLTENPIVDVTRVWSNGKLIWTRRDGATAESLNASDNTSRWSRLTVYSGAPDQMPDPDGHPDAPAYRGRGSVFIKDLGLGSSGAIPNLTFEVTCQGTLGTPGGILVQKEGTLVRLDYETGALVESYPLVVDGVSYPDDWLQQAGVKVPNSNKVWSLGNDGVASDPNQAVVVYEFDPASKVYTRRIASLPGSYGSWMRVSPNGQYLYTLAYDSDSITRITISDGSVSTAATLSGYSWFDGDYFDRFEISPDGSVLVVAISHPTGTPFVTERVLQFFNASTGAVLHTSNLGTLSTDCQHLKYSADGSRLHVSWNNLYVIDTSSYAVLHTLTPSFVDSFNTVGAIAFNQDESVMYVGYAFWGKMDYYSLPSYSYIKTVSISDLPNGNEAYHLSMTMSPDFQRIYVGDWDQDNVWVYDIQTETRGAFFAEPQFYSMPPIIVGSGETTTFIDPTLPEVVSRLCQRAGMSSSQFDVSALPTTPVHGLAISQISSTRVVLEQLASTYFFGARLSDKLYFVPRASNPVASIAYDDMGVSETGTEPVEVLPLKQQDELEIPSQVALTYICESADYLPDTQYSDRLISSQVNTLTVQVPINFTANEAKAIVDAMLQDRVFGSLGTTISVNMRHALYEPGDVLAILNRDGTRYVMRVLKKTESGLTITYELVNDEASVLVQSGATTAPNTAQTQVRSVAPTVLTLLNLPAVDDADTTAPGFYALVDKSGTGNWTGALVESSITGTGWSAVSQFTQNTVMGTLASDLGSWAGGDALDHMNELVVNVGGSNSLDGISREDFLADQSLNLVWVGTIDTLTGETTGEVLRFQNATLLSAGVYRLTGLHRGLGNTEEYMDHLAGEHFLLLSSPGAQFISSAIADIGMQRQYRATTFGARPLGLTPQPFSVTALNLKPYAPLDLRADRSSADTVFTWIRRTRLSTRFTGPIPVGAPLGENSEAYRVTVYGSSFTEAEIKRSVVVISPTWTYTAAMQVADFGSAQSAVRVRVAQISSAVGDGRPLDSFL